MTIPAPPDSPQAAGEPADVNPWAPPGSGQSEGRGEVLGHGGAPAPLPGGGPGVPYWPQYPMPMPMPQPRNGLGIAALVLGIVGAVLGLTVILFWLSWLPALLAVILGAIGLAQVRKGRATNRAMALAGVILGVTGLLVSAGAGVFVVAQVHAVNEGRRAAEAAARARTEAAEERAAKEKERIETEIRKTEAEREARAADERARRLSFGQSYTYEDGLKVTVAKPEPYVPDETVFEAPENATIRQLRITVVNTGSADISLSGSGMLFVRDADEKLVFMLIDGSGRLKILDGSLRPGQEATGLSAYALPNSAAARFTVQFAHGSGLERKDVIWSGPPS
ncbi:DUF4190 domain-containing protein [Kitasatospora sp. NBC_00315]|uniref:DUF4190 domain-containing protein n=1 Tax=Kitasatospora sp. NBC_00315 TaxID=2975963 RepID=UPI00324F24CF